MVPLMDAAPRMSAIPMSEAARRPIDVSPKAANEKVLVRRPETRSGWRRLYYAFSQPQARVLIDELVLSLLPTIRLSDNPEQKIELDDLIFFKYTLQGVGVAPPLHWDGYWGCFPDSAGFQLFYMAEPPARHLNGTGSLVVADSKRPGGEPVIYPKARGRVSSSCGTTTAPVIGVRRGCRRSPKAGPTRTSPGSTTLTHEEVTCLSWASAPFTKPTCAPTFAV